MYTFVNIFSCIFIIDFFAGKIALRSSFLRTSKIPKFGSRKIFVEAQKRQRHLLRQYAVTKCISRRRPIVKSVCTQEQVPCQRRCRWAQAQAIEHFSAAE